MCRLSRCTLASVHGPLTRFTQVTIAVLLLANTAAAQSDEQLEQARAQFREGVQLIEEENWPEALVRFRAVAEVRQTSQVLYNLALCLYHTDGGGPEAARLIRDVIRDPETDDATEERSRALLTQILANVSYLRLRIRGDEAGTQVLVDGESVSLAQVGPPFEVTPGDHTVELRWGRHVRDRQDVTVAPGDTEEVELDANGRYEEEQLESALAADGNSGSGSEEITDQWWFWTAIGVGAVVLLGLVIGISVSVTGEDPQPISGNLDPGILMVMP